MEGHTSNNSKGSVVMKIDSLFFKSKKIVNIGEVNLFSIKLLQDKKKALEELKYLDNLDFDSEYNESKLSLQFISSLTNLSSFLSNSSSKNNSDNSSSRS